MVQEHRTASAKEHVSLMILSISSYLLATDPSHLYSVEETIVQMDTDQCQALRVKNA